MSQSLTDQLQHAKSLLEAIQKLNSTPSKSSATNKPRSSSLPTGLETMLRKEYDDMLEAERDVRQHLEHLQTLASVGPTHGVSPARTFARRLGVQTNSVRIVLVCDGGGVRGLASAAFLACLERTLNISLAEQGELFVGTSTGSFIAMMVGGLGWTAEQVKQLYLNRGHDIMPKKWYRRGIFESMFDDQKRSALRSIVHEATGDPDFPMRKCNKRVILPAYDIGEGDKCGVVFLDTDNPAMFNTPIYQAADASSAAPTFFPASEVTSGGVTRNMVDGGVVMNNPILLALANRVEGSDVRVLSVGTGSVPPTFGEDEGLVSALTKAPEFMTETGTAHEVARLLTTTLGVPYMRINGSLTASHSMADVSEENLHKLVDDGERWYCENEPNLLRFLSPTPPTPRSASIFGVRSWLW